MYLAAVIMFGLFTALALVFTGIVAYDWMRGDPEGAGAMTMVILVASIVFMVIFIQTYNIYTRAAIELKIHNAISGEHVTGSEWMSSRRRLDINFATRIVTGYNWTAIMDQYVTTIRDIDQRDVLVIRSIDGNKDINYYLMHNNTLPLSEVINGLPPISMRTGLSEVESQAK